MKGVLYELDEVTITPSLHTFDGQQSADLFKHKHIIRYCGLLVLVYLNNYIFVQIESFISQIIWYSSEEIDLIKK